MRQGRCNSCQKKSLNLLTANCGHKICFHCVKLNKTSKRCSNCKLSINGNIALLRKQQKQSSLGKTNYNYDPGINFHNKSQQLTAKKPNGSHFTFGGKDFNKERQNFVQMISQKYQNDNKQQKQVNPNIQMINQQSQIMATTRKNMILNTSEQNQQDKQHIQIKVQHSQFSQPSQQVYCRQHGQPFSMFNQISKQIICSVCLFQKGKMAKGIIPLKHAEEIVRRQNIIHKEQSRMIMKEVQNAYKVCKNNKASFQSYLKIQLQKMNQGFKILQKQLQKCFEKNTNIIKQIFKEKIQECQQICVDLQYLNGTLCQYRQNFKQNRTLNQQIYAYQSYKIIKNTIKTLDLDYISYLHKSPVLSQLDYSILLDSFNTFQMIKLEIPLRKSQICWDRKMSLNDNRITSLADEQYGKSSQYKGPRARSRKDVKQLQTEKKINNFLRSSVYDKHDDQQQNGLYKKILRSKFKR